MEAFKIQVADGVHEGEWFLKLGYGLTAQEELAHVFTDENLGKAVNNGIVGGTLRKVLVNAEIPI